MNAPRDVITEAWNLATDYRGENGRGIAHLARDIDRNPTSLTQALNRTGTAKLGLEDAVRMTQFTKDLRILNAFASACSCMVLPLPEAMAAEGDSAMQLVSKLMAEFNDTVQAFVGAVADDKVTGNEVDAIKRQGGELQIALQNLIAHAVSLHRDAQPPELRRVG